MSSICIIPARGGSKRIPRKNIKHFLGKPIIAYSIETALKSGLFDDVIVSTDDYEIAEVAKLFGAKVPFMRSEKNSDDHATTSDVLLEVLKKMELHGIFFDYCCCSYPASPLVSEEILIEGHEMLVQNNCDAVIPVTKFEFPIQRALEFDDAQRLHFVNPLNEDVRTQDLPEKYHDAGQFYWLNVREFMAQKKLWMNNTLGIVLSRINVQDIDDEDDWNLATLKYKNWKK